MSGLVKKVHRTGAPSMSLGNHDLISNLHEALNQLSQKEKIAIHMRYWGTKSIIEVAKHLRISWDSANDLIDSAEIKLREKILAPQTIFASPQSHYQRRQIEKSDN